MVAKRVRIATAGETVDQRNAELALARKRLGATPAEWLQWVVDFAQSDLATLRPGERGDLGQDLRAIPALVWAPLASESRTGRVWLDWHLRPWPMPETMLVSLHRRIGEALRQLMSTGTWDVPTRPAFLYRTRPLEPRSPIRLSFRREGAEAETILGAVVDLLLSVGDRLRKCPHKRCGRFFVALGRQKQRFCSSSHAQTTRNRRNYDKRADAGRLVK